MTKVNGSGQDSTMFYILNGFLATGNVLRQLGGMNSVWTFTPQLFENSTYVYQTQNAPTDNEPPTNTPAEPQKTDEEIKEDIKGFLQNNNIYRQFDTAEGRDIINITFNKYKAIRELTPNITNTELSRRLCNYVKGYLYHQQENNFGLQSLQEEVGLDAGFSDIVVTNPDIKDAIDNNDMVKYKEAFHQQAQEYLEFYDMNNNGVIEVNELIDIEVADTEKELGKHLNDLEQEEKDAIVNSIEEMAIQKIEHLDVNKDKVLDENEIAGYFWARNKWNDNNASNMTYADFNKFETALYGNMTLTDEQKNLANACAQVLSNHHLELGSLSNDLSTLGLNNEEITIINQGRDFLKIILNMKAARYAISNGYEGLKTDLK